MNTVVNLKSKDILQVSWAEKTKRLGKSQRHKNAGINNAIAWGRVRGKQSRCAAPRQSAEAD